LHASANFPHIFLTMDLWDKPYLHASTACPTLFCLLYRALANDPPEIRPWFCPLTPRTIELTALFELRALPSLLLFPSWLHFCSLSLLAAPHTFEAIPFFHPLLLFLSSLPYVQQEGSRFPSLSALFFSATSLFTFFLSRLSPLHHRLPLSV